MTDALETLTRDELAKLGREYLLAGHLMDRAGMPYVIAEFGREEMRDVAIDEWMGASPVYTRRMRRALGFDGDDVSTIFKGMQFDIGAPHQFMDFRFTVHDERHGEFTLASCGALMDVEPMGPEFVVTMCHHIEDPTFDATAAATNPRARMRPVHRPPRVPADRLPHCNWVVEIDPDAEPIPEPEAARWLAGSRAAALELTTPASIEPGGATDYAGAFDPDLRLESFSHATLVRVLDEICLQGHLLSRSFMHAVERRHGVETAIRLGTHQLTGIAGLTARRLVRHLGLGSDPTDLGLLLELHPAFRPRAYVDFRVVLGDELEVSVGPCEALSEGDELTWPALLAGPGTGALDAIVRAADPRARVRSVERRDDAAARWIVWVDPDAEVAPEPEEVALASFSTGTDFRFAERG